MKPGNLSSRIDLQTHTGSTLDNIVTLTFDLFISGSTHTDRLPILVLIAQAVFLFKAQTQKRACVCVRE